MFEEAAEAGVLAISPTGYHILPGPCTCGAATDDEAVTGVGVTMLVLTAPILRFGDEKFVTL